MNSIKETQDIEKLEQAHLDALLKAVKAQALALETSSALIAAYRRDRNCAA